MESPIAQPADRDLHLFVVCQVLALALALAACGPLGPSPVVDGWPIGDGYACTNPRCEPYLRVAVMGLDARDPGHQPIMEMTLHELGSIIGEDGQLELMVFSGGPPSVVLFGLADGSQRAIGVKAGIGGDVGLSEWGPGLNWDPPPGR